MWQLECGTLCGHPREGQREESVCCCCRTHSMVRSMSSGSAQFGAAAVRRATAGMYDTSSGRQNTGHCRSRTITPTGEHDHCMDYAAGRA